MSLWLVNSVDSSSVESLFVDVQIDKIMVYCGTVLAESFSTNCSRSIALLSSSEADLLSELMAILVGRGQF